MLSVAARTCGPRRFHDGGGSFSAINWASAGLLAVILQHLFAGGADLGTILLQAGENGEIALVDYRAAEPLHVAGTSLLLFGRAAALLLGKGNRRKGDRQQEKGQGSRKKFTHRIPSFSTGRESRSRNAFGMAG